MWGEWKEREDPDAQCGRDENFNGTSTIIRVVQAGIQNQRSDLKYKRQRQEKGKQEHVNWVDTGRSDKYIKYKDYTQKIITDGGGVQTINIITHKTRYD